MTRYRAITESGADYVIDTDQRWWTKRGSSRSYLHSLRTPDRNTEHGYGATGWQPAFDAPEADKPVVGRALYVSDGTVSNSWLSTDVVSVEEIND